MPITTRALRFAAAAGATFIMSVGGVAAVAPAAHAQASPVSATVPITHGCKVWGSGAQSATVSPDDVDVTYPETVAPGQTFDVFLQPGAMTSGTDRFARLTYDFALPTNATIIGVSLAGGEQGITTPTSPDALAVVRTNSTGNLDANGSFARIWGGQSGYWGSNSSQYGNNRGIVVESNTAFRLPKVKVTMLAPVGAAGTTISVSPKAVGKTGNDAYSSGSASAIQWIEGSGDRNIFCGSGATPTTLTSTRVEGEAVQLDSTTTMTAGGQVESGTTGTPISAKVTVPGASASTIDDGKVEFYIGETKIGEANPNSTGAASITHDFPALAEGETSKAYQVHAKYAGVPNSIKPSESAPTTFTVVPEILTYFDTATTVSATKGTEAAGNVPVTVTANVRSTPSSTIPGAVKVQFYKDGVAMGEPVAISGGTATVTDSVPAIEEGGTAKDYVYKAVVTETRVPDTKNVYRGSEGRTTLTISPRVFNDITSSVVLFAEQGAAADGNVPVTIKANFTTTPNRNYPTGATAQFYRDGKAVGEPVAITNKTATFTDSVPEGDATYRYQVKYTGATVGDDRFKPVDSSLLTVNIGKGGTTPPTPDDDGGFMGSLRDLFGNMFGSLGS
ncbi:hypothetical protein DQ226_10385 [Dietzia maris]|uniref:Uncharacterized protein n=1 Tax=Dietzia maris TaxID=37915 RepID=A0A365P9F9_9ACTN|nr:hypothetical protein DQ226_10385 [Dietzia maris]